MSFWLVQNPSEERFPTLLGPHTGGFAEENESARVRTSGNDIV